MSRALQLVVDAISGVRVRQMRPGESLPPSFELGFDQLGKLDPEWVWIADRLGTPVGCLVASPCHGVAIVWRLVSQDGRCLWRLLHSFNRSLHGRGYVGYMTMLDPEIPMQVRLQRLITRSGGRVADGRYLVIAAPVIARET